MQKTECRGWFEDFLKTQMNGLTGHIENAGFPFDRVEWGKKDVICNNENPDWWVYEQTAYWVDGFTRCAVLLGDTAAIKRASDIIYGVINSPDSDGYLGPAFLKGASRWPHVVFFRACIALYEHNGDENIIRALEKHYLGSPAEYTVDRDVLNVEIMLYVYGVTKNKALLNLAVDSFEKYHLNAEFDVSGEVALSDKKPYSHGVSYNEFSKLGAILYKYTENKRYLDMSISAYKKIDKYFMLPGGCNCSDEFLINDRYMQAIETCNVSDYTWSLYYLLKITKNGAYGDKIERCVFNAGIGAVLEDFKALQYFSCANQLVLDRTSNHCKFKRGIKWMSYRPNSGVACCTGNVSRFMPNYIRNMWHVEGNDVYAMLFGANDFTAEIGGKTVKISEKTNYPFEENITFEINTESEFDLYIRIPKWADNYTVTVDEMPVKYEKCGNFAYFSVKKSCKAGVSYESKIISHKRKNTVYFTKGALTYSFGMFGDRQIDKEEELSTEEFPAYNIYPNEEFRYAVYEKSAKFIPCESAFKWDIRESLPAIEVTARKIKNFDLIKRKSVVRCRNLYDRNCKVITGDFTFTPPVPGKIETVGGDEKILLKPYGACKVRLTVLGKI